MKNINQLILYIYSNNFNNLKYNLNISEINAKYILYIYRIIKMFINVFSLILKLKDDE